MAALIDASLLIAAERGKLDFAAWLEGYPNESFAIGSITHSELWHGVYRADTPARRAAREAWVHMVTEPFEVVPFDEAAASIHARIWAQLEERGEVVGAHDLVLAATALARASAVATFNVRHFQRVPGLTVLAP